MTIKNVEIVALATAELINAGAISPTEEIHTFQKWKSLGYSVKRGEKAITKLTIWKHTSKVNAETQEEETAMFMKTAAFFSTSQVEKIKPVKRVPAAEMVGKKCVITLR
jgi:antirestriction protein ArdC